jgi:hypothetical protein
MRGQGTIVRRVRKRGTALDDSRAAELADSCLDLVPGGLALGALTTEPQVGRVIERPNATTALAKAAMPFMPE